MIGIALLSLTLSLTGAALWMIGMFVSMRSRTGRRVCLSAAMLCWLLALALMFLPA